MKVYVFCSAAHFNDECTDIMDVEVFTSETSAKAYLERAVAKLTSDEEQSWAVFSKRRLHYQLTSGDEEYVMYVTERET